MDFKESGCAIQSETIVVHINQKKNRTILRPSKGLADSQSAKRKQKEYVYNPTYFIGVCGQGPTENRTRRREGGCLPGRGSRNLAGLHLNLAASLTG